VGEILEFRQHERGALLFGQLPDVREHRSQVRAPLDDRRDGEAVGHGLLGDAIQGHRLPPRADRRQAAVACDGEEPGPQLHGTQLRGELPVRGHEDLLERVLGFLLGAEHVRQNDRRMRWYRS
jgi:hypothetical protein